MTKKLFVLALMATTLSCGNDTVEKQFDEKKMYSLASLLTKLVTTVESTVRYKKPPPEISDEELLKLSTKHDPGLLEPFTDYTLKVFRQSRHGIVLVCTKDGSQGLLEDAGCSAEMDKHLWKFQPSLPCEFTLTVESICQ